MDKELWRGWLEKGRKLCKIRKTRKVVKEVYKVNKDYSEIIA